jgi:hypothetical protein
MTKSFEVDAAHGSPTGHDSDQNLEIVVLFTTASATLLALKSAARLTAGLSAEIRVVVPCVVPYPLPVDRPAAYPCATSTGFGVLAQETGVACLIDIRLCRERWHAIRQAIPTPTIVIIGRKPHWWEFQERALHAELRKMGHHVAYAERSSSNA